MDVRKFSCEDMAHALIDVMTMANFSGFIHQTEKGPLLQFCPSEFEASDGFAQFSLDFGGSSFEVTVKPADNEN